MKGLQRMSRIPDRMKALVKTKAGPGLELTEVPTPEAGPSEALIRVRAAGICGTDVHIEEWNDWARGRIKPPLVTGHEFVGEIAALGRDVRHVRVGDRVSGEGHITCGHCQFCRTGQGHICQDVKIIGVDRDGCFAEYLVMPADNLWPVPDRIPDTLAAVFDPLGNAMHTVMVAPVSGRSVAIIGAGAIGLFAIAIARAAGASGVIAIEPNPFRRRLAAKVRADMVLDPTRDDVPALVGRETEGLGPQVVLEMSGHPDAIRLAFRLVRNGGDVALLGIPPGEVALDWARDVIFKGITIHAVNGRRMYDTWYQCQNFLLRDRLAVRPVITHVLPFENFRRGFELLHAGRAGKVVLAMSPGAAGRKRS
ncbi:MAG: L-threonine 3-dehydrogenase [Planctomycetota bacterium]|nr:L-threonine 3-dehydrogenase [Planctomycetota bacterium]